MSTVNAGNPKQGLGRVSWIILVVGALALVVAALVGPRLIGVLLGLAAPPDPPLPDGMEQARVTHENLAYGVDEWAYSVGVDVCEIARFYHEQAGQCPILPPQCALSPTDAVVHQVGDDRAFCYGDREFSIFAMRWRFRVADDGILTGATRFSLSRVISWTGSLPSEPEAP